VFVKWKKMLSIRSTWSIWSIRQAFICVKHSMTRALHDSIWSFNKYLSNGKKCFPFDRFDPFEKYFFHLTQMVNIGHAYKSGNNLSTSCVPTACSQLFQQVCNKLLTTCNEAWWNYQNCYKVVLTSLIRSWYNKDITRLSTEGCNNLLYQEKTRM
jgi:hypothetical protein